MTYNDSSYGDFWRDLQNLAGSHVAQQTRRGAANWLVQKERQTDRQTDRQK